MAGANGSRASELVTSGRRDTTLACCLEPVGSSRDPEQAGKTERAFHSSFLRAQLQAARAALRPGPQFHRKSGQEGLGQLLTFTPLGTYTVYLLMYVWGEGGAESALAPEHTSDACRQHHTRQSPKAGGQQHRSVLTNGSPRRFSSWKVEMDGRQIKARDFSL